MDADFLLIHKMKNGDEEAIEVFVKKYYSTIRNYCRLHTYTDCDAEDITQATFEHFFRSFRSYHHLGKTANYLYVIARNLCRDSYKKKRDIVMEELPDKGENPIAVIENKILKLPTPIWCIEPCYENKNRSQDLNLDNKCFQQL